MNIRKIATLLLFYIAPLMAQTPAVTQASAPLSAAPIQMSSSELGFSLELPSDWAVIDTRPAIPVIQQQTAKTVANAGEKKAIGCVQLPLKATHGVPPSSLVVVGLTFECFGKKFTERDLPSFAEGFAASLKKTWNIVDPEFGAYMLGTHSMWIERATGNPLDHPETRRSIEVVCSLLKTSAVCWMIFTADEGDLKVFEQSKVTLNDEQAVALVPPTVFVKKP
jgi:hypothetical protein